MYPLLLLKKVFYNLNKMEKAKYNLFVSANAKYAPLEQLEKAKNLAESGELDKDIHKETGWFQGKDNKWMFEISDNKAEFHVHMETVRKELFQKDSAYVYTVKDLLSHPTLFMVYPHLQWFKLYIINNPRFEYKGSFTEKDSRIILNAAHLASGEEALSTLLHELQHAVQHHEGLSSGSNPNVTTAEATKALISEKVSSSARAANEWVLNNSALIDSASKARDIARYASLYSSYIRLASYIHSGTKLTSVCNHIRREAAQLSGSLFSAEYEDSRRDEAMQLDIDWYNLPRSNYNNKREQFLQSFILRLADLYSKRIPPHILQEFADDARKPSTIKINKQNESFKRNNDIAPLKELNEKTAELESLRKAHLQASPLDIYFHTEGEVWARATQKRANLSDSDRSESYPYTSVDVEKHKIIPSPPTDANVRWNNLELFSPEIDGTIININKGYVEFSNNNAFAKIILNSASDASTIIHEAGHIFLEMYSELNKDTSIDSNSAARENFKKITEWFGISEQKWFSMNHLEKEPYHEKFACAFEDYIKTKDSQEHPLASVFNNFKNWLTTIYQTVNARFKMSKDEKIHDLFEELTNTDIDQTHSSEFKASIAKQISESLPSDSVAEASATILDICYQNIAKQANKTPKQIEELFTLRFEKENDSIHKEGITFPKKKVKITI
ncbi:LPD23 domain-containing protein [Photobacterium kishitanii]|uniref:Large polyvalent protein associated domain-containing protein n=1 Tax=Photobacterium kishitanii TaxID=318456 RepID=A0A2T3KLN1_9GAMM|nr:LPD23 domain-containing protein [Photobacterium kishitanii]PSV00612.1 hypothetical protein C9J27_05605 [Photobacterium kishitanii]